MGLKRKVLEFTVRHPKSVAAAATLSAFLLQGKSFSDTQLSDPTLACGALLYTGLTFAKDYWLEERDTIDPKDYSLYESARTFFFNNPKIAGSVAGLMMKVQWLSLHPHDYVKSTISYLAGFALGYWSLELGKQRELVQRGLEKKKRKGLWGRIKNLYDSVWENMGKAAWITAGYTIVSHLRLDLSPLQFFQHAAALGFVSGIYGLGVYLAGTALGGVLHTSSLEGFRLAYCRKQSESSGDLEKAIDIQEEILERPMSTRKRLKETARLVNYYFILEKYKKGLALISEMVGIAGRKRNAPSPYDMLIELGVPKLLQEDFISNRSHSSYDQGVELALSHFLNKDFDSALKVWNKLIASSANPDYFRILKAQNMIAMGKLFDAGEEIADVILENNNNFIVKSGSKHKILSFKSSSDIGEVIVLKTPLQQKSNSAVESLRNEYAVLEYIQSCVRDRSPVPMIFNRDEGEDMTYFIMSHLQGESISAHMNDPSKRGRIMRALMPELAVFQKQATHRREKLSKFHARVPELSLTRWGKRFILERLLGRDEDSDYDNHFISSELGKTELETISHKTLFSNGDLQINNLKREKNFLFLDFERACFALPAFTLFGLFEDARTNITREEADRYIKIYLDEINRDGMIIPRQDFDYTYSLIFCPRMLATIIMFHEYAKRRPIFREKVSHYLQRFREHEPRELAAKEFKHAAFELIYSSCLEEYLL